MLAAGAAPATSDEAIWGAMLREFDWLHRQMDRKLRARFAPVFALFELKTIVLCLRNKAIERTAEVDRLLARSLLAESMQRALRSGAQIDATVGAVIDALAATHQGFRELEAAHAEEGFKGFENALTRIYLQQVVEAPLAPLIRQFFALFIDMRNAMVLYKQLRWGVGETSPFIAGGSIAPEPFEQTLARKDHAGLEALVKEATGLLSVPMAANEGALETVLLRTITKKLREIGRATAGSLDALVLDYVWRLYVQARNLAILHHARDVARETLEQELIL
jgi:vacuolar-type H+-ATPase subunit C/Vma6